MELKRIAVDTSKSVCTVHGIDAQDQPVLRRNFSRSAFAVHMARQPATQVALEACGGSHHWSRVLTQMGHRVRLIPPQYVKPFVKRGKNDRNDAEAICEAARRPGMGAVPIKLPTARRVRRCWGSASCWCVSALQAINALRGHAAEFGIIAAKGTANIAPLMDRVQQDQQMPHAASEMLGFLAHLVEQLDGRIRLLEVRMRQMAATDPVATRLAQVPGIGPIGAITLSLTVDATQFSSGRHFAAWLGLVPKERSTGGRQRLGGVSRQGDERLRQLLVVGAMAVVRVKRPRNRTLYRRPIGALTHFW